MKDEKGKGKMQNERRKMKRRGIQEWKMKNGGVEELSSGLYYFPCEGSSVTPSKATGISAMD